MSFGMIGILGVGILGLWNSGTDLCSWIDSLITNLVNVDGNVAGNIGGNPFGRVVFIELIGWYVVGGCKYRRNLKMNCFSYFNRIPRCRIDRQIVIFLELLMPDSLRSHLMIYTWKAHHTVEYRHPAMLLIRIYFP